MEKTLEKTQHFFSVHEETKQKNFNLKIGQENPLRLIIVTADHNHDYSNDRSRKQPQKQNF